MPQSAVLHGSVQHLSVYCFDLQAHSFSLRAKVLLLTVADSYKSITGCYLPPEMAFYYLKNQAEVQAPVSLAKTERLMQAFISSRQQYYSVWSTPKNN